MKKTRFGLLAALALILGACSNESDATKDNQSGRGQHLSFIGSTDVESDVSTRKVGNEWEPGDQIGVFGFESGKPNSEATVDQAVNNKIFETSDGKGIFTTLPGKDVPFPEKGKAQDYVAYFPYLTDVVLKDFMYPINISDQTNLDAIDFLYSSNLKNIDQSSTARPELKFKHQLSKLQLNINIDKGSLADAKVELKAIHTKAEFHLISEALLLDENSVQDITPHVQTQGNGLTITALVIPTGKTQNFQVFITLADGTTYKWKVPADWKWKRGERYSKSIRLENDGEIQEPVGYFELPVLSSTIPTDLRFVTKRLSDKNSYGENQRNFSYLYDIDHKISYWVAYPLHEYYAGDVGRHNTWNKDTEVEDMYQVNLKSGNISWYNDNGCDRGHQIASGDRQATLEMNYQTFLSTNATPQTSDLNQGIWQRLESQVRDWVADGDTLYVVTGADFEKGKTVEKAVSKAGNPRASIPHYYYKVLAQKKKDGQYYTIGFRFDNTHYGGDDFNNYRKTVKEIEEETGYTFFPGLPDAAAKETIVESMWK